MSAVNQTAKESRNERLGGWEEMRKQKPTEKGQLSFPEIEEPAKPIEPWPTTPLRTKRQLGAVRGHRTRKYHDRQRQAIALGYLTTYAVIFMLMFVESFRTNFSPIFIFIFLTVGAIYLYYDAKIKPY
jgi:hypothetical protein